MNSHNSSGPNGRANWSRINQWLLWIGLAAAVAWLFFGHREHVLKLAPFLILLACPLMHLFGHGGRGGHGGHAVHGLDEPIERNERADRQSPQRDGGERG
jgi:hypothetical protein